ncbi:SPASM domain-containing protein [bacterium]|nr:SPASM domain-containing protein [Nanoarchaeota archaeon]MBU1627330.1 SPASM domain-containing protein [bacterium]
MKIYDVAAQIANHQEYATRKVILSAKPVVENIEVISACNLRCSICVDPPKRKKKSLSLDEIMEITKQNSEVFEGESVWLHHYGEPLLHSQITDIIQYLSSVGVRPRLSTNGILLTPALSRELIKAGLSEIVFSVDGSFKESYERIRVGANYETVMENVRNFLQIKKESGSITPETQVQFVDVYGSNDEAERFTAYWSKTDVNWINIKIPSTRAQKIADNEILTQIRARHHRDYTSNHLPCSWLWTSMVILSDGDVIPCCTDLSGSISMGNVFELPLMDIWNGERARQMREDHIAGTYKSAKICKTCPELKAYTCSAEEKLTESGLDQSRSQISFSSHRIIKNV